MRECRRRWQITCRHRRSERPNHVRQLDIVKGSAGTASIGRAAVARARLGRRLGPAECPFLHGEIGFEIYVPRRRALLAEPQGSHAHVDARWQQVHDLLTAYRGVQVA
jgi:hypothetical protein